MAAPNRIQDTFAKATFQAHGDRAGTFIVGQLTREMSHLPPVIIEYRGNPKQYVSVVLDAINQGRLTYDGIANCEQTFRALASVVDVISPKNGKTLSVETLVSYEKKKRAGEFEEK